MPLDLSQAISNLLQVGGVSISSEKYLPYNKGLSWTEYAKIHQTNPVIANLVKKRKANIGANGWDITSKLYRSQSRNENLSWQIYNRLEKDLKINRLIDNFSTQVSVYGNAYGIFNDEDRPVIQWPSFFNLYYDSINQTARQYKLVIDGRETGQVFEPNTEIYHFKEPDTAWKPLADSPIDSCYAWILLYDHAVQMNNSLVSSGWLGALWVLFEKEMMEILEQQDDQGNSRGQQMLDIILERLRGVRRFFNPTTKKQEKRKSNDHKLMFIPGAKDIKDLMKTNRDMQLGELLEKAIDEMHASFGFTRTGKDSTYNNAQTFNYEQWDNVGRSQEEQFADYVNSFLLPHYGIETNEDLFFHFNPPNDPDELANKQFFLSMFEKTVGLSQNQEYRRRLINELRDKVGLDEIEDGLVELPAVPQFGGNLIDVQANEQFAVEDEPTPTEKALESKEFKRKEPSGGSKKKEPRGFLPQWEKSITKQLKAYIKKLEGYDSVEKAIKNLDKDFPKIETYYSFNALEKDLLRFADLAIKQTVETFADEDDFEFPQAILDLIEERTQLLLKGDKEYKGVDAQTASQINTILKNILDSGEGIQAAIQVIDVAIPDISRGRAKRIAETEVSAVVEGSRFALFEGEGYKFKRHLGVNDSRESIYSREASALGVVPIDYEYTSAWGTSKVLPLHPHERSTLVYGMTEEDIS